MNRNTNPRPNHLPPVTRTLVRGVLGVLLAALPATAWGQTGGSTGTTGTLGQADFFLGVQKVAGTNLNLADQARFLDRASCDCARPAWLRALLLPAAAAKAAAVSQSATVSMYLGNSCNTTLGLPSCLRLMSKSFSDFRVNGMLAPTTVDVLARLYGSVGVIPTTGGSGGAGGAGATPTADTSACAGMITQTVWLLVETTPGLFDVASASLPLVIDGIPPPAPTDVVVGQANEALIVSWKAVDSIVTSDLAGYQVFCTRADQFKVFDEGTFTTSVDSCKADALDLSPSAITDRNTHFICSDFLSPLTTSFRVKTLENGITYTVGVASVDTRGNASLIGKHFGAPLETVDFYHSYRSGGETQGEATGGYCAVAGTTTSADAVTAGFALGTVLLVARARRRRAQREDVA